MNDDRNMQLDNWPTDRQADQPIEWMTAYVDRNGIIQPLISESYSQISLAKKNER